MLFLNMVCLTVAVAYMYLTRSILTQIEDLSYESRLLAFGWDSNSQDSGILCCPGLNSSRHVGRSLFIFFLLLFLFLFGSLFCLLSFSVVFFCRLLCF
jgi:hypothetical protein